MFRLTKILILFLRLWEKSTWATIRSTKVQFCFFQTFWELTKSVEKENFVFLPDFLLSDDQIFDFVQKSYRTRRFPSFSRFVERKSGLHSTSDISAEEKFSLLVDRLCSNLISHWIQAPIKEPNKSLRFSKKIRFRCRIQLWISVLENLFLFSDSEIGSTQQFGVDVRGHWFSGWSFGSKYCKLFNHQSITEKSVCFYLWRLSSIWTSEIIMLEVKVSSF